jgi:hypothetical protein
MQFLFSPPDGGNSEGKKQQDTSEFKPVGSNSMFIEGIVSRD